MSIDKLITELLPYQQQMLAKHFEEQRQQANFILRPNHIRPTSTYEREQLILRARFYSAIITYIDNRTPKEHTQ